METVRPLRARHDKPAASVRHSSLNETEYLASWQCSNVRFWRGCQPLCRDALNWRNRQSEAQRRQNLHKCRQLRISLRRQRAI